MTPLQKALQKLGANDFNFSEEDLKELRIYYDDAAFARIQQRIKERGSTPTAQGTWKKT